MFQSPLKLIVSEIIRAEGASSILAFEENSVNGKRVFSNTADSNAMNMHPETIHSRAQFVCFDLYADGTTLSKHAVQYANNVRLRLVNVRRRSREWDEV